MTVRQNEHEVLRVACLTADRSPREQRAMLAFALRLDVDGGNFAQRPSAIDRPRWVEHVRDTYDPSEDDAVDLNRQQGEQYARLTARWEACDDCHLPHGMHPVDRCPDLTIPSVRELAERIARA